MKLIGGFNWEIFAILILVNFEILVVAALSVIMYDTDEPCSSQIPTIQCNYVFRVIRRTQIVSLQSTNTFRIYKSMTHCSVWSRNSIFKGRLD